MVHITDSKVPDTFLGLASSDQFKFSNQPFEVGSLESLFTDVGPLTNIQHPTVQSRVSSALHFPRRSSEAWERNLADGPL